MVPLDKISVRLWREQQDQKKPSRSSPWDIRDLLTASTAYGEIPSQQ